MLKAVGRALPSLRVLYVVFMSFTIGKTFSQDNQQVIYFKNLLRCYKVFGNELVLIHSLCEAHYKNIYLCLHTYIGAIGGAITGQWKAILNQRFCHAKFLWNCSYEFV